MPRAARDLMIVVAVTLAVLAVSIWFDLSERLIAWTRAHEAWELDEFIVAFIALTLGIAWYAWRRGMDAMRATTGQSHAEQALELRDRQILEIGEELEEAFWVTSADETAVHYVSPGFERLTGRSRESIIAEPMSWLESIHPEDRPRVEAEARAAIQRGPDEKREYEFRVQRPDGAVHWVLVRSHPVKDDTGTVMYRTGVGVDITSRREVDEALAESEHRFRQLAEHIEDVFWLYEPNPERALYVSPAFEQIWECTIAELYEDAQRWEAPIHPADRNVLNGFFDRVDEHGEHTVVYRLVCSDGSLRWIQDRGFAIRDEQGTMVRVAGIASDVTERRLAEELASTQQQVLEYLAAGAPRDDVLERLCAEIEALVPDSICTVMLLEDGTLNLAAGPNVPDDLSTLLADLPAEEGRGSCASAAATGDWVIVSDTGHDPRWAQVRPVAEQWNIRSCWSIPIRSESGAVLGTFAISLSRQCTPGQGERRILATAGHVAGIALVREQAIAALRDSEDRYALATAAARVGVWDWDVQRGTFYLDPNVKAILGYDDDEIPNDLDVWAQYVHPDDREPVFAAAQAYLEGRTAEYVFEHRMLHKDGSVRWILVRGNAVRNERGEAIRLVGTDADITERKKVELALAGHAMRLRMMLEQLPAIVWSVDHDLRFTSSLGLGLRGLGLEPNEVVGMSLEAFLGDAPSKEQHLDAHRRALAGESVHVEADLGGNVYECYLEPLHEPDGSTSGTIGVALDVTERVKADDRQRLMMRELDHRVRNNIASLQAIIDLTARRSDDVPEFADSIQMRVRAMARVHELLSSSRWRPVPFRRVLEEMTPPEGTRRVSFEGEGVLVPAVQGTALGMVVHELMTNSLKYGALGSAEGHVTIGWTVSRDETTTRCEIRWLERGGPAPDPDATAGLGTQLVTGLVGADLRGSVEFNYPTEGADHRIMMQMATADVEPVPVAERLS